MQPSWLDQIHFFHLLMGQKSLIKHLITFNLPHVVHMIAWSGGLTQGKHMSVNHCITEQWSSAFVNNQDNTWVFLHVQILCHCNKVKPTQSSVHRVRAWLYSQTTNTACVIMVCWLNGASYSSMYRTLDNRLAVGIQHMQKGKTFP